jgi:hypothetical protein
MTELPLRPSAAGTPIGTGGDGDRGEKMGDLEVAQQQPVADVGPGDVAHQFQRDALIRGEALVGGSDEHGGVGQRDVPGAHGNKVGPGHFSSSAAVMMDWAISTTLRWSFIAFERSAA